MGHPSQHRCHHSKHSHRRKEKKHRHSSEDSQQLEPEEEAAADDIEAQADVAIDYTDIDPRGPGPWSAWVYDTRGFFYRCRQPIDGGDLEYEFLHPRTTSTLGLLYPPIEPAAQLQIAPVTQAYGQIIPILVPVGSYEAPAVAATGQDLPHQPENPMTPMRPMLLVSPSEQQMTQSTLPQRHGLASAPVDTLTQPSVQNGVAGAMVRHYAAPRSTTSQTTSHRERNMVRDVAKGAKSRSKSGSNRHAGDPLLKAVDKWLDHVRERPR
ncbi:hypothetical protein BN1708_008812 [Verticillium longisporum]|uniref:Uncharacterized protein n=1 Tax=Verticillium longisporum TaxID=100787 RepID=A0A0G4N8A4_VERLO|nr:hypothetical protein HYQ44_018707 [Verticillium longisporum]CRK42624.1 hypothetical protein BN1708_008812 [Verticillium longisporum]